MNVYSCWYHGLNGYCCRSHNAKWMFVPELGQIDNRIHKQLSLNELVFDNPYAKAHELKIEQRLQKLKFNPFHLIKSLFFPESRANTVGGMLFSIT